LDEFAFVSSGAQGFYEVDGDTLICGGSTRMLGLVPVENRGSGAIRNFGCKKRSGPADCNFRGLQRRLQ